MFRSRKDIDENCNFPWFLWFPVQRLYRLVFKGVSITIVSVLVLLFSGCAASPMHVAAENNNTNQVKLLLKEGIDINIRNNDGETPLHVATERGNIEVLELLLASGADINAKNKYSMTPLHRGVCKSHIEVVKILLSKGANVNAKGDNAVTPLHFAVDPGNVEIVKLLLDNGAAINARNSQNMTPLFIAVCQGHKEIVQLLLANGADINIEAFSGIKPLDAAVRNGYNEIADLLIQSGAKRDKLIIVPVADCPGAPGSGKAFMNSLYSALFEKLKHRYDVIDIAVVEQELAKLGQGTLNIVSTESQKEIAKKLGAEFIVTGELTIWKRGGWTEMPVVGFSVRCRSVATSTVRWNCSHSDSVFEAALEKRTPEIAARDIIEKAIKAGNIN